MIANSGSESAIRFIRCSRLKVERGVAWIRQGRHVLANLDVGCRANIGGSERAQTDRNVVKPTRAVSTIVAGDKIGRAPVDSLGRKGAPKKGRRRGDQATCALDKRLLHGDGHTGINNLQFNRAIDGSVSTETLDAVSSRSNVTVWRRLKVRLTVDV